MGSWGLEGQRYLSRVLGAGALGVVRCLLILLFSLSLSLILQLGSPLFVTRVKFMVFFARFAGKRYPGGFDGRRPRGYD